MAAEAPVVAGVDVGGTKVLVGCVTRDGIVVQSRRYPMNRDSQESTLESITSALQDFVGSVWPGPFPQGIGLGLVGLTDPQAGIWVQSINLRIHSPVSLAAQLHECYGVTVALDNDVHAATLAELRLGAGREVDNFIYLNVGTGIAAGLVCNGKLVRGADNYAGELGHVHVADNGPLCVCGRRGCLEPIASGGGMLERVRAGLGDYPDSILAGLWGKGQLTAQDIFHAAEAGDPLATEVARKAVRALADVLTNLVNLLNPELIVYGGGVLYDGWLMERVRDEMASKALPAAGRSLRGIFPTSLDPELSGLLGAACLAWDLVLSGKVLS